MANTWVLWKAPHPVPSVHSLGTLFLPPVVQCPYPTASCTFPVSDPWVPFQSDSGWSSCTEFRTSSCPYCKDWLPKSKSGLSALEHQNGIFYCPHHLMPSQHTVFATAVPLLYMEYSSREFLPSVLWGLFRSLLRPLYMKKEPLPSCPALFPPSLITIYLTSRM